MNPALGIFIGAIVVLLLVLAWSIAIYNRFVTLRLHIRESWSDIDVELVRRYELVPNLVAVVKGYAKHERETLERVVELRNIAASNRGAPDSQASDESSLMLGVRQVFAIAEAYPQLKADTHFLELQRELALTEDRIAASRRFFNANVRNYNALCRSVPTNIVAGMFGHEPQTYFEIRDEAQRVVPRVELDS